MIHNDYILVDKDGNEIEVGSIVSNSDGKQYILVGGASPHKPSSTGFVYVKDIRIPDNDFTHKFYAQVIDAKWIDLRSENEEVESELDEDDTYAD
jgi:hypothetical protein